MGKAFDDKTNETLRGLARAVLKTRFDGNQSAMAEKLDVSASFVSDFLSRKRGAGLELLSGLGRFAPLELLGILGIAPGVIVTLVEGQHADLEAGVAMMPEVLKRAARAAVELEGCSPGEAGDAAVWCYQEHGAVPGTDADWWLAKIRKRLAATAKSGERASVRLQLPAKTGG